MAAAPAPRILVGDDDPQIRKLVRDVLQSLGYVIDTAQNGGEFLDKYRGGDYSLLIVDTVMSPTSGMEVVMKLRDQGDNVPIMLLSVPTKDGDRVEPFAFTYRVGVLRKPFGVGDLRTAVQRALGSGHGD